MIWDEAVGGVPPWMARQRDEDVNKLCQSRVTTVSRATCGLLVETLLAIAENWMSVLVGSTR